MRNARSTWLVVSLLTMACSNEPATSERGDGSSAGNGDGPSGGQGPQQAGGGGNGGGTSDNLGPPTTSHDAGHRSGGDASEDGGPDLDGGGDASTGDGGDGGATGLPKGDGAQGVACSKGAECQSGLCYKAKCTHPDIVEVRKVQGESNPGGKGWMDSYSYQGKCYCKSNGYDHGIGDYLYEVKGQMLRIEDICEKHVGEGPIKDPAAEGHPIYNDIQCGNGPANTSSDETTCPGRVDIGPDGCGQIGPKWAL